MCDITNIFSWFASTSALIPTITHANSCPLHNHVLWEGCLGCCASWDVEIELETKLNRFQNLVLIVTFKIL